MRSSIGLSLVLFTALALSACAADEAPTPAPVPASSGDPKAPASSGAADTTPPAPAAGATPASGTFGGAYDVPVSVALAGAAHYDVTEFTWTVANGTATLAYNLPRALIGKALRVDFTGPFDPASGHATLTGAAGISECVITPAEITCTETMRGLLPITTDLALVEKLAAATYAGPAADRVTVTNQFAGDPIGIARLDLQRPGVPEVEPAEAPHP